MLLVWFRAPSTLTSRSHTPQDLTQPHCARRLTAFPVPDQGGGRVRGRSKLVSWHTQPRFLCFFPWAFSGLFWGPFTWGGFRPDTCHSDGETCSNVFVTARPRGDANVRVWGGARTSLQRGPAPRRQAWCCKTGCWQRCWQSALKCLNSGVANFWAFSSRHVPPFRWDVQQRLCDGKTAG